MVDGQLREVHGTSRAICVSSTTLPGLGRAQDKPQARFPATTATATTTTTWWGVTQLPAIHHCNRKQLDTTSLWVLLGPREASSLLNPHS